MSILQGTFYTNRIISDCIRYVDNNCFKKITLNEIAQNTFYKPTYLSKLFKQHLGMSLSEYIKDKRLTEAANLLLTTNLSNENIMYAVGYTDKKQFYKLFKDRYNMTPAEYRKQNK